MCNVSDILHDVGTIYTDIKLKSKRQSVHLRVMISPEKNSSASVVGRSFALLLAKHPAPKSY